MRTPLRSEHSHSLMSADNRQGCCKAISDARPAVVIRVPVLEPEPAASFSMLFTDPRYRCGTLNWYCALKLVVILETLCRFGSSWSSPSLPGRSDASRLPHSCVSNNVPVRPVRSGTEPQSAPQVHYQPESRACGKCVKTEQRGPGARYNGSPEALGDV